MLWLLIGCLIILIGVISSIKFREHVGRIFDFIPLALKWAWNILGMIGIIIFSCWSFVKIFNFSIYAFNRTINDIGNYHITTFSNISFALFCGIFIGIPLVVFGEVFKKK